MVATAPRVVVIGAQEGVRLARAARLAGHYGLPRHRRRSTCWPDVSRCPRTATSSTARRSCSTGWRASAVCCPRWPSPTSWCICGTPAAAKDGGPRVLGYYEARGVLVGFRPETPVGDIIVAVEAALRGRTAADPPRWP